jgi:hypothetical protein
MTLCRSRGEPNKQRAKRKARRASQQVLLKGSLLHALCESSQAHCLVPEGSPLDRSSPVNNSGYGAAVAV